MIVVDDLSHVPEGIRPSAVTIGKFDGVHAGHRAVLAELIGAAERRSLVPVVVTFDRNPLAVLRPELCPENLVSLPQKLELLGEVGVAATVVLEFDRRLADWTPEEFVQKVLVDALQARLVLVGADFRFGAKGAGTVETLRELGARSGFEVQVVGDVLADGARASSSRIRALLDQGNVEGATELLGRAPCVRGEVVHGLRRGRELGYPTANLAAESEGLAPGDGVYAGWLTDRSAPGRPRYPAAISVGTNPTFGDVALKQVEAYVLDEDLDLYGHTVEVEFQHRLRGMVAYAGVGPLIEQMGLDVAQARAVLGPQA
ncbi:bifunctional riboflavin kinase/FAD synthetase [Naasia aerilata]|uniref:Riboflavin biosynthesis protein n=1 Tax=Naasia aerilata TaxID=1162966 RepID=A0ABM8GH43_9MICO|nr:bifunctional riboflavin kinase/FAD synthetase [Naasia aerilata]BDZ47688.1 riboflavin biosynthesis protein [Naasia aerilata]